ncbi:MAG: thiamine pyrophosphate-dependent enzyme, partial [Halodesulfurarchaeum sp.]
NFAGVFDVPAVFFCNNNQWAISVPRERQTAADTLAQKAHAYGFEGVQVDGMDPLAVYQVAEAAVEKAKNPDEGQPRPTMIEAIQYRFGAHTTADDPSVYRDEEEVERWRERDPIPRLETFLLETGRLSEERVDAIQDDIEEEVAEAIDAAESAPRPEPESMFEHTYAEMTDRQREQLERLETIRERYGDEAILED